MSRKISVIFYIDKSYSESDNAYMNGQTLNALRDLAAKLGTTADQIWTILVAGQRTNAILDLVCAGFFILAAGILGLLAWKFRNHTYECDGARIPLLCILGGFSALMIVGASAWIYGAIKYAINPQYNALMELLRLLK